MAEPKDFIQKKIEVQEENLSLVYKPGVYGKPQWQADRKVQNWNLFLVGLRGSGKSSLAKAVAEKTGKPLVDTDELVQAKAGKTIAQIVAEGGWEAFRDLESQVLAELCATDGQVVATGGGMVLRPQNRELMRARGKVFYLMASTPTLKERLAADPNAAQRPSLSGKPLDEELRDSLREREPLYLEIADIILEAGKELGELAEDVVEKLPLFN